MVKMGIGYDIHPLKKGSHLVVGGTKISGEFSSDGHSDGDALIHAIIDAILGATNLGDIGQFFPSDEKKNGKRWIVHTFYQPQ
jgi:2-C-methyl-D-erythritol 2,4-cyclodiphosphate synthase